jgi:UDP-N-acetylmuramoyl-L-alanyl-D-glutamate--2,6-diaminopimelate ligase
MIKLPHIYPVTCHTNHVGPGTTFIAIKGSHQDGKLYIPKALKMGAQTIIVDQKTFLPNKTRALIKKYNACIKRVCNTRKALANLSSQAFNHPAKKLSLIGITGTKGKTSTAYLVHHMLNCAGYKTALLSTVENRILNTKFKAELTTAQPDYLHTFLKVCVDSGVTHVVIEIAAQAVSLYRVHGLKFDAILMTNFEPEHGEFYQNTTDYFNAKAALFQQCKKNGASIINGDDKHCATLLNHLKSCSSFGQKDHNTIRFNIKDATTQLTCSVTTKKKSFTFVAPHTIGVFNAYNFAGALAIAISFGITIPILQKACTSFKSIPGRMNFYKLPNGSHVVIDYAHTPSSYQQVLSLLRSLSNHLIVVFGLGGERDPKKRPEIGALVALYADKIFITSDNPRSEDPHAIMYDIMRGIPLKKQPSIILNLNREQAIKKACLLGKKNSIIALLGKGADEYEMIKGTCIPFSEKKILESLKAVSSH